VPEETAGLILVANGVAWVIGCAVVPVWVSRRGRELAVLATSLLVTVVACVVLAVAPGVVTGFVALALIGFGLLPALPIVLALTERRAGSSESTAAGLMWLTGNLGGLVVAAVVGVLVGEPLLAFLLLAVLSLATLPLLWSFSRVSTSGTVPSPTP
jgi:predicted MFS family arabinose efflux permease